MGGRTPLNASAARISAVLAKSLAGKAFQVFCPVLRVEAVLGVLIMAIFEANDPLVADEAERSLLSLKVLNLSFHH